VHPVTEKSKMPEIYVHAVEGRTPAQKKALMKDITDAVVRHFDVPLETVVVTIVECPKINKAKGGVPFSER
jgi:4-oxalocrotonate tautomerase